MKLLGISALVMTVLSLVLWLFNWVIITFFLAGFGYGGPLRHVSQAAGLLAALAEYVALALVSIGLVLASKKLVSSEGQSIVES